MSARDRVLYQLKAKGPQSAGDLAKKLGVTATAVRQHLAELEADEFVEYENERRGVGRPARIWRLAAKSQMRFPDSHGELTVGLLQAMRQAFGEDGLAKLVEARTNSQVKAYRARIPSRAPLEKRVAALAAIRKEEGYMAEWRKTRDGKLTLVENHCPICAAAQECQGLCAGELRLFRTVLGRGVHIERTEHLLEGARRCVYKIS